MIESLVLVVAVIFIAGLLVWLLMKAPFIDGDFKEFGKWVIIVIVAIWCVIYVCRLLGIHLP